MMDKHKKIVMIMCSIGLMLLLTGITYSYFNYTKTGDSNNLIAGDIYLTLNEGNGEIELSNVFPETKEEARARNDNYITFSVNGLNTSNKTIYYEFILNHGEDKASPKSRYNDEDLRFDLVEIDSSGNEISYLLDNETYDTLINKRIYTDMVEASTTTEVTRYYKLRMWLNENVVISDTETGANYTATEYHNKYATIKLTVLGDFTEKSYNRSLYSIMKKNAVMDNVNSEFVNNTTPGIDFGAVSSDTNGKGIYTRAGTENDTYPVVYYRGAVENNNVLFNNKCWKTVRTTDTGGVKLIYNGELSINKKELTSSDYGTPITNTGSFTFDSTDNTWNATVTSTSSVEITFNVPVAGNYSMIIKGAYGSNSGGSLLILKDEGIVTGTGGPQDYPIVFTYNYGALTTSNKIGVRSSASLEHPYVLKVKVMYEDSTLGTGCDNMGTSTEIIVNNTSSFVFNTNLYSPAYNGYMYGTAYTYSTSNWTSNAKFGSGFTWDGTKYKLIDATVTTPDATHHYSCNQLDADATCTDLRYVFYMLSNGQKYYITLNGGDSIENAIEKMQTNTNSSNAKTQIDSWYGNNMNTVTNKLEDTIWCNDRSMGNGNNNGWIANGGDLSTSLYYGAAERSNHARNTSTVKNRPSLACAKNDAFTVSNRQGNQKLTYPVALLTEDEMVLAGGVAGMGTYSYLSSGNVYWSLSPYSFASGAHEFSWESSIITFDQVTMNTIGLRPSISLKPGTQVASGTGTAVDPYVIE